MTGPPGSQQGMSSKYAPAECLKAIGLPHSHRREEAPNPRASFLPRGQWFTPHRTLEPTCQVRVPKRKPHLQFFFKTSFIEVELPYKIVIICAAQQSDSLLHVPTSILFQALFPHR